MTPKNDTLKGHKKGETRTPKKQAYSILQLKDMPDEVEQESSGSMQGYPISGPV